MDDRVNELLGSALILGAIAMLIGGGVGFIASLTGANPGMFGELGSLSIGGYPLFGQGAFIALIFGVLLFGLGVRLIE